MQCGRSSSHFFFLDRQFQHPALERLKSWRRAEVVMRTEEGAAAATLASTWSEIRGGSAQATPRPRGSDREMVERGRLCAVKRIALLYYVVDG